MTKYWPFLLLINPWFIRICQTNIPIATLIFFTSVLIIFKKNLLIFIIILCILQAKTNQPPQFTPTPLQKEQQFQRINFYPQKLLPLPYYYEARPEITVFRQVESNFISIFNLNAYFFAYHPRQDNSLDIYPKFHFLLLVPFLIGAYKLIKQKRTLTLTLLPLVTLTFFGHLNPLGTFCLFPFFIQALITSVKT